MPGYGYTDATGLQHESYEDACHYYGADSPADLAAEDAAIRRERTEWEEHCLLHGVFATFEEHDEAVGAAIVAANQPPAR